MANSLDLVCFSHLRWGFVFQRPNHLMSRFAKVGRVFFVEEPVHDDGPVHLEIEERLPNLWVCTPHINSATSKELSEGHQRRLVEELVREQGMEAPILWFYTPMAIPLAVGLHSSLVVYDCMDELAGFLGAPVDLLDREQRLFSLADVVFAGGHSLYESKRLQHPSVFLFASSVDDAHFALARRYGQDPADQAGIGHPRLGFFGVIDERIDLALLETLSKARPDYHIVMVGPVVKIDEASLPRAANVHYLGMKQYAELPAYIGGWQVAIMPFALNAATRFISPTKTLEYLAAGKPIVSTAVRDVVNPYGHNGVVRIADADGFPAAVDAALKTESAQFQPMADEVLSRTSWDRTWAGMYEIMNALGKRRARAAMPQKGNNTCSTT